MATPIPTWRNPTSHTCYVVYIGFVSDLQIAVFETATLLYRLYYSLFCNMRPQQGWGQIHFSKKCKYKYTTFNQIQTRSYYYIIQICCLKGIEYKHVFDRPQVWSTVLDSLCKFTNSTFIRAILLSLVCPIQIPNESRNGVQFCLCYCWSEK